MLSSFSSYFFHLVLVSFSLASIQLFHPMPMVYLCYLLSTHVHHTVHPKSFFLSYCTRKLAQNAVNADPRASCTENARDTPGTAPSGVTTLEIEDGIVIAAIATAQPLHWALCLWPGAGINDGLSRIQWKKVSDS